ncbi:MAG: hypothetical protein JWP91_2736 [Fibrobacteres bacterium]|nr:hypothetical protein [Fibrobacterota bacterium]
MKDASRTGRFLMCVLVAAMWQPILGAGKAKPIESTPQPAKPRVTDSQKDFCNLVWGCGLPVPPGYCPDPALVEKPKFVFDSTRCQEARLLNSRGVGPGHPLVGFNL